MDLEKILNNQRAMYKDCRLEMIQLEETLQAKKDNALRHEGAMDILMYLLQGQKQVNEQPPKEKE